MTAALIRSVGSSPLARGLRSATDIVNAARRIIPARAGFTREGILVDQWHPDHPRSRGVYLELDRTGRRFRGSSPLARGLRGPLRRLRRRRRIIPARAGFTEIDYTLPRPVGDHPRSRGVYAGVETVQPTLGGSSPLARGLRVPAESSARPDRIIPARAGFTATPPERMCTTSDHPRSRGVYGRDGLEAVFEGGSSPLARGLRSSGRGVHDSLRIIPARAGFTLHVTQRCGEGEDHPRSRGVYRRSIICAVNLRGSSPLARGLRLGEMHAAARLRIIPARAGFTGGG